MALPSFETFEFLNLMQNHGMPRVMGVLTHLDTFKDVKKLRKTKQRLKHRFWTEIYDGAKLFYSSGLIHGNHGFLAHSNKCEEFKRILGSHKVLPKVHKRLRKHSTTLTMLLKKDSFTWNKEAQRAFEQLKESMTSVSVLVAPNFELPFEVQTDASSHGIGAVLVQQSHPIAYLSKAFSPQAKQKLVYKRELMLVVFAVHKWSSYLLGRKFIIKTDQRSLQFLQDQRVKTPEQQRWLSKLMGFFFDI
ncbi:hypothetical protein Patl1_22573 [Pistacia atlantica]|uniref:Uncharacterized protein n=1 Tax=Pistacia atlantica TaxID=434234 RepID=A0ACC0ZVA0_9ROSI|nr:hypothetical protein Patl1_22573 [Pistacia atlantica]